MCYNFVLSGFSAVAGLREYASRLKTSVPQFRCTGRTPREEYSLLMLEMQHFVNVTLTRVSLSVSIFIMRHRRMRGHGSFLADQHHHISDLTAERSTIPEPVRSKGAEEKDDHRA